MTGNTCGLIAVMRNTTSGDVMEEPTWEKDYTGRTDAPGSGSRLLDRINAIFLQVYGPAVRSPRTLHGAEETELVHRWHEQMQQHFAVETDEEGNEYLYHRDTVPEEPPPGSTHNY